MITISLKEISPMPPLRKQASIAENVFEVECGFVGLSFKRKFFFQIIEHFEIDY